MTVRMWPTLPKDAESNGLHIIEKLLVDEPEKRHVVIAIIDQKRVTVENDDHETIPTARVLHIEPITTELDATQARRLLVEAHTGRTGAQTLPFEASRHDDDDDDLADDDLDGDNE